MKPSHWNMLIKHTQDPGTLCCKKIHLNIENLNHKNYLYIVTVWLSLKQVWAKNYPDRWLKCSKKRVELNKHG